MEKQLKLLRISNKNDHFYTWVDKSFLFIQYNGYAGTIFLYRKNY